jgi:cellulose synthase/poly-beta-1,6-N-acetylglucosamine synthase-like glycosyltransferase
MMLGTLHPSLIVVSTQLLIEIRKTRSMLKVAVVTPYYNEREDVLQQCHVSVLRQSYPCTHVLVADGHPNSMFDEQPNTMHIVLPQANADMGNTPRAIGGILAEAYGFDAVAYLDADNWYDPWHIEGLIEAHKANSQVSLVSCKRRFYDLEGRYLYITDADEDSNQHVDTSCWIVFRPAFSLLRAWLMPKVLGPICDRIFLQKVAHERFWHLTTDNRTVAFRTNYASHYRAAGVAAPADAKLTPWSKEIVEYLCSIDGAAEITDHLGFYPRLLGGTPELDLETRQEAPAESR